MPKVQKMTMDAKTATFHEVENWIQALCRRYRGFIPLDEAQSIALVAYQKAYSNYDRKRKGGNFMTYVKECVVGDFRNHMRKEKKEMLKRQRFIDNAKNRKQDRLAIDQFMLEASDDSRRLLSILLRPSTKKEQKTVEELNLRGNSNPGKVLLHINEKLLSWEIDRLMEAYLEIRDFVNEK